MAMNKNSIHDLLRKRRKVRGVGLGSASSAPFPKRQSHPHYVIPFVEWRSTGWPPVIRILPLPHEVIASPSRSTCSRASRHHQADGAATCSPPVPRPRDAPGIEPARMAPGGTRLGANARSRSALILPGPTSGAWNVAIFCADRAAGEAARLCLSGTLAALDVRVPLHVRQWRFTELPAPAVFEAAVDHALEADLVIVAGLRAGPIPEALEAVLAEWLFRAAAAASPLVAAWAETPGEKLQLALQRLTDRAHAPLYTSVRDAVLVARDLWEWRHFPSSVARGGSPFDAARHWCRRQARKTVEPVPVLRRETTR